MTNRQSIRRDALALDIAVALLALLAALGLSEIIHSFLGIARISLVFLAAVTVAASIRGSRSALVAALAGVFFYRVFLDMRVGEQTDVVEDVLNVVIFLVVALVTGALAGRVRDEAARSRIRAGRMEALFKASRTLSEEDDESLWPTVAGTLAELSDGPAFAFDETGAVRGRAGDAGQADPAATQLVDELLPSPANGTRTSASWSARALVSQAGPAGVLVWQTREEDEELEGSIALLAELASASIARARTRQEQVKARAAEEAGKLREALLSSISHDFRSPLAAIIGSSTSLLEYGDRFDEAVRHDLLLNIHHEGEKLNQFVTNLLNLTRLHSGVIQPSAEHLPLAGAVRNAIERLERHRGEELRIRTEGDCEAQADPLLLEQAIYNIVDNAVKYGGPPEAIEIVCRANGRSCDITVTDAGPGLPESDYRNMFTSFHFVRTTGRSKGTGLGLSIAKGFVEAMGGTIEARGRGDGKQGLEILIELPREQ